MSGNPRYTVERVGKCHQPVVIIDEFHPHPDHLRAMAQRSHFQSLGPYYPGVQAPADPKHISPVGDLLSEILRIVFGARSAVSMIQCSFSRVTVPDEALTPIQRLPHIDTPDPGRIALLHYLSGEETGGTAFYRHRATGHEILTTETYEDYRAAIEAEGEPKAGYMRGSDDRYDMIGSVAAKPNRAVLYRSQILHSGMIPETLDFEAGSENGRLTVNTFFQIAS